MLAGKISEKQTVLHRDNGDFTMFRSAIADNAFRHSEILSNVSERRINLAKLQTTDELAVDIRAHPYSIILTPDCDLDWDFKTRYTPEGNPQNHEVFNAKEVPTILLCEVVEAQTLKDRQGMNSKSWKIIRQNNNQRYHFISQVPPEFDLEEKGIPELGIDFKRYFTIPTAELYWQVKSGDCKRHTWLGSTYLEHLSHRFGDYMSRVALPHDYESL